MALVMPTQLARGWVGPEAAGGTGKVLARAMGGRDLALGMGAVLALRHGGDAPVLALRLGGGAPGWLAAGGLADAGDSIATLLAWRALPKRGRWAVLGLAGGSVVASGVLARLVDRT